MKGKKNLPGPKKEGKLQPGSNKEFSQSQMDRARRQPIDPARESVAPPTVRSATSYGQESFRFGQFAFPLLLRCLHVAAGHGWIPLC
jgi:hypothetical protein